jgi:hypothetical protein
MDHTHLHARARTRGVNPIVSRLTRAVLQSFAHLKYKLFGWWIRGLAGIVEGKVEPARWTASLTAPEPARKTEKARAA